jgi:paraquat-inducible protein B
MLGDLCDFMKTRKKFWLLPIVLVTLLVGGLLIFAQASAMAPFIYTLF